MPRPTSRTENKRKQYNAQDSFRWTTPKVDEVARPVDAFEQQGHTKVIGPSEAGKLRPMAPTNLPAPIAAAGNTPMRQPVQNPFNLVVSNSGEGAVAVLGFVGAVANAGMDMAKISAKNKADTAIADYDKLRESGMSHQEALKNAAPETILGLAEDVYFTTKGAGDKQYVADLMQRVADDPANKDLDPNEMYLKTKDVYLDLVAGTPDSYRRGLGGIGTQVLDKVVMAHTDRLKVKAKEDDLRNFSNMIVGNYKFIQDEYKGDGDKYFRNTIDEYQVAHSMLGITKDEITSAAVTALGQHLADNPTDFKTVDDVLGWVKVPDKSGVTAFSNPKVANAYLQFESHHVEALHKIEVQRERETAKQEKAVYDGLEGRIMEAFSTGKSLDGFMDELKANAGTLGIGKTKQLENAYREAVFGEKVVTNPEIMRKQQLAIAENRWDAILDDKELDHLQRSGQMSWSDYINNKAKLADVKDANYKTAMADMKKLYPDSVADKDLRAQAAENGEVYVNERVAVASDRLNTLIQAEKQANNGLMPHPRRMTELVKETKEYTKEFVTTKSTDEIMRLPKLDRQQKITEIKKFNPDFGDDQYDTALEAINADLKQRVKGMVKPAEAPKQKQESKPAEPVKPQKSYADYMGERTGAPQVTNPTNQPIQPTEEHPAITFLKSRLDNWNGSDALDAELTTIKELLYGDEEEQQRRIEATRQRYEGQAAYNPMAGRTL